MDRTGKMNMGIGVGLRDWRSEEREGQRPIAHKWSK